jgi:PAS domain S-box-containing protein
LINPDSRDTGDRFLALLHAMPDGVVLSDGEGKIVLVNGKLEELSGYPASELVGRPLETLIPLRLQKAHRENRAGYYASGLPARDMASGLETSVARKDGAHVPVDIALSPVRLDGRALVLAAVRDATERKRAEAAIKATESRWRQVLQDVRLLVVGLDMDGRITYTNPFLRQLSGYSEEELLERDWFEVLLRQEAVAGVRRVFRELSEEGTPAYHVNPIWAKDGERRIIAWYNTVLHGPDGSPVGTLSIGEDITERKRYQDGLEAVVEVARGILENRPIEEVLRVIARWSRVLVDGSVANVVTPEDRTDRLVVRVADGAATELEGVSFERAGSVSEEVMDTKTVLTLRDASEDPRDHQPVVRMGSIGPAIFAPLAVSDRVFGTLVIGRPLASRGFSDEDRSVLELFAAQAAIALEHARYQSELRRLAVFEDRDRIARDLHDGAIQDLFGTGMRLRAAATLAGEDAAPRIMQAIDEVDKVITDLRNYIYVLDRASSPGIQAIAALHRIARQLEERAGVVTVVDLDDETIARIEPIDDLLQFVREALSNVARHARAETCRVSVGVVDGRVTVEVDDDGRGFDVGSRLGTGNGLVNLRRRAEVMGATFELESVPGSGTTLRVVFPAALTG